jgi:hypothetical protein
MPEKKEKKTVLSDFTLLSFLDPNSKAKVPIYNILGSGFICGDILVSAPVAGSDTWLPAATEKKALLSRFTLSQNPGFPCCARLILLSRNADGGFSIGDCYQ